MKMREKGRFAMRRAATSASPTRSVAQGPFDRARPRLRHDPRVRLGNHDAAFLERLELRQADQARQTARACQTGTADRGPSRRGRTTRGAVLDAVGSESAALFGDLRGGPMSVLFAATYPSATCSYCSVVRLQAPRPTREQDSSTTSWRAATARPSPSSPPTP